MTNITRRSKTLDRLLEKALPDEHQIAKIKRVKKSRGSRTNKARKAQDKLVMQTLTDVECKTNHKNIIKTSNLKALLSWNNDSEQVKDLESRIVRNRNLSVGPKSTKAKRTKQTKWPGLTPGLAPVGYETSDEEDDDD